MRAILSGLGYARTRTPHQLADMKVARRALKRDNASSHLSSDVGSIQVKMVFLKWPSGALWLQQLKRTGPLKKNELSFWLFIESIQNFFHYAQEEYSPFRKLCAKNVQCGVPAFNIRSKIIFQMSKPQTETRVHTLTGISQT